MGLNKRAHIAALLDMPAVAEQWIKSKGSKASDADIDSLYAEFIPLQVGNKPDHFSTQVVPHKTCENDLASIAIAKWPRLVVHVEENCSALRFVKELECCGRPEGQDVDSLLSVCAWFEWVCVDKFVL